MMQPLGLGLRDTLDNLLPFTLLSLAWWGSVFLVITAPAGTLALITATDPRRLDDQAHLDRSELLGLVRRELLPSWGLAAAFGLPIFALLWNLRDFGRSESSMRWLAPIWIVLLLLIIGAAGMAGSLRAIHAYPNGQAIRLGLLLTLAHAHQVVPIIALLWVIVAVSGLLVIPAVMFLPALVASVFHQLTYASLGIPIADPLDPTPERLAEEQRTAGSKYSVN